MVQFCYIRLYLGIENVSCRLLLQMARMDIDWNQVLNAIQAKITPQMLRLVFPDENVIVLHLFNTLQEQLFKPFKSQYWPTWIFS